MAKVTTALNAAQMRIVLETIAVRTDTLNQLLAVAQGRFHDDVYALSICLDAAQIVATGIGALADVASGGENVGNANHWNYGPDFDSLGKEKDHG